MITLLTGLPGNGKTLHLIWLIEKLRKESGRDVYYWNISDLTLPWKPLGDQRTFGQKDVEPDQSVVKDWFKLPDGAIIVIDECQKLFRVRKQGSAVPKMVSEFETHRHKGFDVFLASQNLKQIDTAVRVVVGRHINCVRRFGFESSTLYQWEKVSDPNSTKDQAEALKTTWNYPKDLYGTYKSAEVHTVKKDFPVRKLAVLGGGVLLVLVSIGYVVFHVSALKSGGAKSPVLAAVGGYGDQWGERFRAPRVYGVPESAPVYDEAYKVVSAPSVAGCMQMVVDSVVQCTCTTGQSSVIDMPIQQCLRYMKYGWFDPTKPSRSPKQENIAYLNARDGMGRSNEVDGAQRIETGPLPGGG